MGSVQDYSKDYNFHLISSNRLEILAASLACTLQEHVAANPLQAENIIVQSRGMERWLRLKLAHLAGVSANINFPFPRAFASDYIFNPLLNGRSENIIDPALYTWKIFNELPDLIDSDSSFSRLQSYLADDHDGLKAFQLSARIAGLFEQYLIFRPDLIKLWNIERNPLGSIPDSTWQYKLWRRVVRPKDGKTFAGLYSDFLQCASPKLHGKPDFKVPDFSALKRFKRIFLFGFSSIAPAFIDIYYALSRYVDVYFYYLNPSEGEWQYDLSERGMLKLILGEARNAVEKSDLRQNFELGDHLRDFESNFMGSGNPLLASLGAQGREFFGLLGSSEIEAHTLFPGTYQPRTLLKRIQADIQQNCIRGEEFFAVMPDDSTIQIHSCHSPMREVEVLMENITAMFEADPKLLPSDIIVLLSDVETYAPYVEAVFKSLEESNPRWTHIAIADRTCLSSSREAEAFIGILKAARGRFKAAEVVSLLEIPVIAAAFGLNEDKNAILRSWIEDAGISWGLDSTFREQETGVAFAEQSWQQGLDRMLAGFAFGSEPENSGRLFETSDGTELLPFYCCDSDNAAELGALCRFISLLAELHKELSTAQEITADWWNRVLCQVLDNFFPQNGDFGREIGMLREVVAGITGNMRSSGCQIDATPEVMLYELENYFENTSMSGGFLRGGITFCEARPLRSIPAKVICMLGLDERSFPRGDKRLSFDLMAARPRFGDRSSRNDDRYLFLEALLSARDIFYMSYVGQGVKDNEPRPPSVVVSEIIDYAHEHYETENLTVRHPLQAFSWEYFNRDSDAKLISYSAENANAARALLHPAESEREKDKLTDIPEELLSITLDDLCEFFVNPSQYFLRRCLSVEPKIREEYDLNDAECFDIDGLGRYKLAEIILREKLGVWQNLDQVEMRDYFKRRFHSAGAIPVGAWGDVKCDRILDEFFPFADRVSAAVSRVSAPVEAELKLKCGLNLQVKQHDFYETEAGTELIQFSFSGKSSSHKRLIRASVAALVAEACEANIKGVQLFGRDYNINLKALGVKDAIGSLEKLGKIYCDGLTAPLPFFPKTSTKFYTAMHGKGGGSLDAALGKASKDWLGSGQFEGESSDPSMSYCFGREFKNWTGFSEYAATIVSALRLDARREAVKSGGENA
ncbi:MAG: exodeoxyribonuclease V subunit gamma [Lentisphaerae bacterium]|nr:exodeoxyribonuclease V subunit gamma [Lentisphaerota bacterium]MCP4100207.1 exodeoxyribonuclease V subunit gamma [Lentisphaerota bacterium]